MFKKPCSGCNGTGVVMLVDSGARGLEYYHKGNCLICKGSGLKDEPII